MRAGPSRAATVCAIAIAAISSVAGSAGQPSVSDVVARLDAYLVVYEPQISELIANETMTQERSLAPSHAFLAREALTLAPSRARRRIRSEVAFVALPNNAGWLGFRHVKSVNNRRVEDASASLTKTLQLQGFDAAESLLKTSAQFNIGLPRTTNLPNLPLEFLHQHNRNRMVMRLDGTERVRGVETTQVVFVEGSKPTLIQNPNEGDMPSVVRAWVDARGRLLRAEVNTFASADAVEPSSRIRVEFAEHKALGMLVPSEMRETFPVEPPARGYGVATYSNFRRFQTAARIVPVPQS